MGVHLYDTNDEGDTVLHKAALKGKNSIVEYFVGLGFDVTVRNKVEFIKSHYSWLHSYNYIYIG